MEGALLIPLRKSISLPLILSPPTPSHLPRGGSRSPPGAPNFASGNLSSTQRAPLPPTTPQSLPREIPDGDGTALPASCSDAPRCPRTHAIAAARPCRYRRDSKIALGEFGAAQLGPMARGANAFAFGSFSSHRARTRGSRAPWMPDGILENVSVLSSM